MAKRTAAAGHHRRSGKSHAFSLQIEGCMTLHPADGHIVTAASDRPLGCKGARAKTQDSNTMKQRWVAKCPEQQ